MAQPIWSDSYIDQLDHDADDDIIGKVDCIFDRFQLAVTAGESTYTLPDYCRKIIRVTYKGRGLDSISFSEMQLLHMASFGNTKSPVEEAPQGDPYFYCLNPSNAKDIRFYPTPPATINLGSPDVWGADIGNCVIISCWRTVDRTNSAYQLPSYINNRTKKAYVLSKAYAKEGRGQDLNASQYFGEKYAYLIENFKKINAGVYVSKKYRLSGGFVETFAYGHRPPKPILPPNYENVRY